MKFATAFILCFVIFCAWNYLEMKRRSRQEQQLEDAFWERESEANSVRRKPIDQLEYIQIPEELPRDLLTDDINVQGLISTIDALKGQRILNLTGRTNTDLKLEYGTANITALSTYDQNYTTLITSFQKWAEILLANGYETKAIPLLEFIVATNGDIGQTYRLLAKHYLKTGEEEKYEDLLSSIKRIHSINKNHIYESVEKLKESDSFNIYK